MPNAVPFESGLIGLYNNSTSPGVYVAWDSNTSFNSVFSLIFRGNENTDYRFPLIVNSYNNTLLGTPVALGQGTSFVYVLNSAGILVAYKKVTDNYTYLGSIDTTTNYSGALPDKISVTNINGIDYVFATFGATNGFFDIYTFSSNTFNLISHETFASYFPPEANYDIYDFVATPSNIYFVFGSIIYQLPYTISGSTFTASTATEINPPYGTTPQNIKKLAIFDDAKIAGIDTNNIVYEFLNLGPTGVGNTTGNQWGLNFTLSPTNENYQAIIYNNIGLIIACDAANDTINLIAGANVTVTTKNYGSNYQIVSITETTNFQGQIINSIGSNGTSYLQFNAPSCVMEDNDFNLVIGDYNNRLTYFPTELDYVGVVGAPLNEYIDQTGNPAFTYYIKQSTIDFASVFSLPPITGDELLLKSSVLYELNALLRVPVYDEEPLFGYLRQSATLAYGDIVTDPEPQVRITCSTNNGQRSSMFVLSPYVGFSNSLDQAESDAFAAPANNPNYPNGLYYRFTNEGKLYFFDTYGNPISIQEYDTLLVTYYVKMFTNKQINNALYLALQAINAQPGVNKIQRVSSAPFYYDQALVSGATYYLLRQLVVGLNQRERRLLVMDPEQGSFDAVSNLKDTAKMYQEEFAEVLKKLPLAVRPVMGTITVPEYSMPGGRSRLFRSLWKNGAS